MRSNASGAVRRAWRSSRRAADGLLAVLLAPRCLGCGLSLDSPTGGPVCASCWRSIGPLSPPLCARCGDSLDNRSGRIFPNDFLCTRCRRTPAGPVTVARAAGEYAGPLRQLIHSMKYDGRQSLAAPLAALMRERGDEVLVGATLVVPVPLHWRRRWQRGFNQAEALAARLGLPLCRALVRRRPTRPQFGLATARRHRNVRGAFRPAWRRKRRTRALLEGAVVVLVDDVATTGATLRACAEVLEGMGAREVRALTAARAHARRP